MRNIAPTVLLLCVLPCLGAQSIDLGISSCYEWPRQTEVCWTLSAGDLRLLMKTETDSQDGAFDPMQATAIAVDLPWIRFGPLRATGVMREALNPLGFTAQSSVFRERTGLSVKGSLPSGEQGFLCMPFPDDLGLFCVPLPDGGLEYGCFCSLPPCKGMSAEGFVSLSRPAAAGSSDEWYRTVAPFPGGSLLDSAGRLLFNFPSLSIAATAGSSSGERVEPGMFGHLCLSTRGRDGSASLLIGGVDAAYRTPEGGGEADMLVLSAVVEAACAPCGARLGYTMEMGRPGFAPGPVLPTRETVTAVLTRGLCVGAGCRTTGTVEARKRASYDTDGCRVETARYCARICTSAHEWEGQAEAGWSDEDGWGCFFLYQASAPSGLTLGMEAELGDLASDGRTGSVLARMQFRGGGGAVSVRAGINACPLLAGAPAKHINLRISWTRHARLGAER